MPLSTALRAPGAGRCLVAAVLAAFVAGLFGGLAHHVTVAHATCAEHGGLVHVDGEVSEHAHAPEPETAAPAQVAAIDAHGEHDHCSLPSALRDATVLDPPHRLARAPGPVACTGPVALAQPLTGLGRYRLAPKTSPPA